VNFEKNFYSLKLYNAIDITMSDKVNPFDGLRVDPERSRRIKRIIFIAIIALLLLAFVPMAKPSRILDFIGILPLAVGY